MKNSVYHAYFMFLVNKKFHFIKIFISFHFFFLTEECEIGAVNMRLSEKDPCTECVR